VFENRIMRKVFGRKKYEVIGDCRLSSLNLKNVSYTRCYVHCHRTIALLVLNLWS
jgi:hypothetical protein